MGWGFVGDLANGAKKAAGGAADFVGDKAKQAGRKFDSTLDKAGDVAKDVGSAAKEAAKDVGSAAKEAAKDVGGAAKNAGKAVGKTVSNASFSDIGHTVLDVAGMVPVIGEAADLANAAWYLAEGDKTNAALSAAGAIPFVGNAATAAKWGNKAVKGAKVVKNAADGAEAVASGAKVLDKAKDGAKIVADATGDVAGKAGDVTKLNNPALDAAKAADTGVPQGFRQVSTGGKRGETPLTAAQKTEINDYADKLGIPDGVIRYTDDRNTMYGNMFGQDVLYVGTDVLPAASSTVRAASANSRVSAKGALAHEWVGHRAAAAAGKTQDAHVLEEAQASIRAAKLAPDLSSTERVTLLRDGVERLHDAGLRVSDVRDKLWIK